jgi:hypothetical protein
LFFDKIGAPALKVEFDHGGVIMISVDRAVRACLLLALFALVVLLPPPARAGQIEVSGYELHGICEISDLAPKTWTLYVFHVYNPGEVSARFKIQRTPNFTMTYVSETHPYPMTVGDTQTGMSVCYGECEPWDRLIATMTYVAYGTSGPCARLQIVPHPLAETVEVIQCDGIPASAYVDDLVVNHGSPCGCGPDVNSAHVFPGTPHAFGCQPVAAENETWGGIKALYR